jgi:LysR family glycine cleavage system transcriptional activator
MPVFNLPPLNALRVFEAAARLGSFKAAADELSVTPSAVSHQIANLEAVLNVPLFDRAGRKLSLNETGEAYSRGIHDALSRLSRATEEATDNSADLALNILASPSFASKWLMPRIDDFLSEHPEWRVRVEATTAQSLLSDADVGIFYGAPTETGLDVTPIVAERVLVLCSPKLMEQGPPLKQPSDVTEHVLIDSRNRHQWRNWLKSYGIANSSVRREMSVGRSAVAIDAALQGLGIILESDFLAADEIADGRLIAPFDDIESTPSEDAYFLVTRHGAPGKRPVTSFVDWISREIAVSNRSY